MDVDKDKLGYFIHPFADVQSLDIGQNTRIWQFCVVLKGAKVGANVNICSHCFIENDVRIGDPVTIKNGVSIFDGVAIENDVFIGPNVTFTNDKKPRSKVHLPYFPLTLIKQGASVGASAVILPGITIGEDAIIGAGAIVTKDVPNRGVVYGDSAKLRSLL